MNSKSDFHKKENGVVINTNSHDFRRARKRNLVRKEQDTFLGDKGRIAQLEKDLAETKNILKELMERL